jgi:hypothetical protein
MARLSVSFFNCFMETRPRGLMKDALHDLFNSANECDVSASLIDPI